ncbi:EF-hand domain-containing protein [Rubinisphaera margarita]|uniref:EF-hand domain-containing protein n=1 Tax=Rubinisphaera margarita TaxID=2909586 RepID=UPI001EE7E8EA|nr:EF-hand domain-containing protein [Rubinisphaera margarita]MCG6158014.1 EF-hand domain-containing protein [Rubinisphaera margarita]
MLRRSVQCVVLSGIIAVPAVLAAQPPGRGRPPGGPQGAPPPEMIFRLFQQADADRDGSVTKAELTAALKNHKGGNHPEGNGPPPEHNKSGEKRGAEGRPAHEGHERHEGREGHDGDHPHGHHGPPPEPGQILPEPVAESLKLSREQTREIAALQAGVDKRLASILTEKQMDQLKNARPPHGSHHEGEGPVDRPQRPQRAE